MPAARQPSSLAPPSSAWMVVSAGAIAVALAAARFAPVAAATILAMGAVATVVLHRRRVDPAVIGLLLGGLALDAHYASYTSWIERNPDANSHVLYMRQLLDSHRLPAAADCSVCHHPPVYYVAAASVLFACERSRAIDPGLGLQLFSLALFVTFLASAGLLVHRLLPRRLERAVAMTLVAFWPYGVIHSVRVNNDALLCALAGLVLSFLADWFLHARARSLWIACGLVLVALATKASALSLVVLVLLVVAHRVVRSANRRSMLRGALPPLLLVLSVCALQGVVRGNGSNGSISENVLGTAYKTNPTELGRRSARFYLTFEPRDFVRRPFVVVRMFRSDEPTYWNQLLKSSLFGVRNAPIFFLRPESGPSPRLGQAMNAGLLGVTSLGLFGLLLGARRASPVRTFCLLAVVAWIAVALAFHVLVPYSFHADFRFVLPVLLPLSVLFALGLGARRRHGFAWRLWPAAAAAFALLSIVSFLPSTWTTPPVRSSAPLPGTVVPR